MKNKSGMMTLAWLAAVISLVAVAGVVGFQMYIRWVINQNFTLLGGSELEVLTFCAFALTLGLVYVHHRD